MSDTFGVDRRHALSPLRGFRTIDPSDRGLTPTAKLLRRYATEFARHFAERYTERTAAKPQFSLRMLFVAVAVVALIAAEAVAFPGWLAFIAGVLITSFLPPVLVAGAFYARGFTRAFCIGALAWLLAAHWIARISLGVPTTQEIELTGPNIQGMPGMGGMSPPGILSQPNSPYTEQFGVRYRSSYCAICLLTIVGGLAAVVVRWLTLSAADDEQPRSGERV